MGIHGKSIPCFPPKPWKRWKIHCHFCYRFFLFRIPPDFRLSFPRIQRNRYRLFPIVILSFTNFH